MLFSPTKKKPPIHSTRPSCNPKTYGWQEAYASELQACSAELRDVHNQESQQIHSLSDRIQGHFETAIGLAGSSKTRSAIHVRSHEATPRTVASPQIPALDEPRAMVSGHNGAAGDLPGAQRLADGEPSLAEACANANAYRRAAEEVAAKDMQTGSGVYESLSSASPNAPSDFREQDRSPSSPLSPNRSVRFEELGCPCDVKAVPCSATASTRFSDSLLLETSDQDSTRLSEALEQDVWPSREWYECELRAARLSDHWRAALIYGRNRDDVKWRFPEAISGGRARRCQCGKCVAGEDEWSAALVYKKDCAEWVFPHSFQQ